MTDLDKLNKAKKLIEEVYNNNQFNGYLDNRMIHSGITSSSSEGEVLLCVSCNCKKSLSSIECAKDSLYQLKTQQADGS